MNSELSVSDKVVLARLVDLQDLCEPVPAFGQTYVVREVSKPAVGPQGVRLIGVKGVEKSGQEVWFDASIFRRPHELDPQSQAGEAHRAAQAHEIPIVKAKWMTAETEQRLFGAEAKATKLLTDALAKAHKIVKEAGWTDHDGEALNCLGHARREWQSKMAADRQPARRIRRFFSQCPKVGDTLSLPQRGRAQGADCLGTPQRLAQCGVSL